MKKLILFFGLLLAFQHGLAQETALDNSGGPDAFISAVKHNQVDKLSTMIRYPLRRPYPLLDIVNEQDFIQQYHELIDEELKNSIGNSTDKTDWTSVGSKGIMFNRGKVWLDHAGKLIALNYQSKKAQEHRNALIEEDKSNLHESLKDFDAPVLILETEKFSVRIDQLANEKYRYASWSSKAKMSEKPDLILTNGTWIADGNGGNHNYEFLNGEYKYVCYIYVITNENDEYGDFYIYKNDVDIFSESILILKN